MPLAWTAADPRARIRDWRPSRRRRGVLRGTRGRWNQRKSVIATSRDHVRRNCCRTAKPSPHRSTTP